MNQHITRTEHSAPTRQFTVPLSLTRRDARLTRLLTTAHLSELIVEALADHWGIGVGPVPRKTVRAELDLAPEPFYRVADTHDPVSHVPAFHDA
ncbi:hypothetical protein ACIO8F_01790 [Streptomyces sp. NPDC087228]|uniref:hypothetical protein n=1 Tax=unclassified Streptomyces TaxID=2593676 RepID=UPI003827EB20